MAASVDNRITVGDRQVGLRWTLQAADGTAWPLTAVTVRMVNIYNDDVKIDWATATVNPGGIATYAFTEDDVDTPGLYAVQMRDTNASGKEQHWPAGRKHILEILKLV